MSRSKTLPGAMCFYHGDGFVPAWKQAIRFVSKGGRIGTLPDIINARLSTKPDEIPWNTYFTTLTSEFLGLSRGGVKILIVAHGVGPMSTLDGILKAYSYEFKNENRNHRGGRIRRQEFLDLESGKYGEVQIVEFTPLLKRYRYPFIEHLRAVMAINEPLLRARFGPKAKDYIKCHTMVARKYHAERGNGEVLNPYILQMDDAANCPYEHVKIEDGLALAHLVSIGGLANVHLSGAEYPRYPVLACDVSCHEWWNGVRLLGIRENADLGKIHSGADVHQILRKHWQSLMKPVRGSVSIGFVHVIKLGGHTFTEYQKKGDRMDTGEPEFLVTSISNVGEPKEFTTTIGGYYGFFKYGIREVKVIAPPEANAYSFIDEPQIVGDKHRATVQFHRITADTSQHLRRHDDLQNDYDTLMALVA